MVIHYDDLKYAAEKEKIILPILRKYFDPNIRKSSKMFSLFDFYSDEYQIELKCRNNTHNKYVTTMVGSNKINESIKNSNLKSIYCFQFLDGLFYYEFNKEHLNKLITCSLGGRTDRGVNEIKEYHYIPINLLKKLE